MGREDEVKLIAYNIWEQEGCINDHDREHWYRAEFIWEQQQKPESAVKSSAGKPQKKIESKTKSAAERKRSK